MEDVLYGISAFRYHRVPPQVLALMPPFPRFEDDRCRFNLCRHLLVSNVLGLPVHMMMRSREEHSPAVQVKRHLQSGELPFGHIAMTELGVSVPSPALTLFQLASSLSVTHLAMAMYEMCGTFSVFRLSSLPQELASQVDLDKSLYGGGWRNVRRHDGKPTDLWSRPPLIELTELEQLAIAMQGRRGCRVFSKALKCVTGVVASPFEAQLSLLLATPRCDGGEGVQAFSNNTRIKLNGRAERLAGRRLCYADILFEMTDSNKPLIVECQGKIVHGDFDAAMSDSDRTTALQQMGFNVILLTYSQIANVKNFDIVKRLIFEEAGIVYREKTQRQLAAQGELRRELFIDWNTLGA